MSKFSIDVLNKSVYPFLETHDPDVILGAVFGEDVALTRIDDSILVSHLDPIVGAVKNIGWLAVHVACNDIATSGAPPRWILILVLVPKKEDEQLLDEIMCDIGRAARRQGSPSLADTLDIRQTYPDLWWPSPRWEPYLDECLCVQKAHGWGIISLLPRGLRWRVQPSLLMILHRLPGA